MVRDNALSESPMTVNTRSGVATLLTDGCSGAGKALNKCDTCEVWCDSIRGRSVDRCYDEVRANGVDA